MMHDAEHPVGWTKTGARQPARPTQWQVAPTAAYGPLAEDPAAKPSRLWLWFVAVFLLQVAGWTAWFMIASQNKVAEVPLATKRVSGLGAGDGWVNRSTRGPTPRTGEARG